MKIGDLAFASYIKEIATRTIRENNALSGMQGYCIIKDNQIIKIYKKFIQYNCLCDLTKYSSSMISFPVYYLEINNKIVGEVMPYRNFKTLDKGLTLKSRLDILESNYKNLILEIKKFPNIYMNEISYYKNILYSSKDGFYLIDTMGWATNLKNQTNINIKKLNMSISDVINSLIFMNDYISKDYERIKQFFGSVYDTPLVQEFMDIFENYINSGNNTMEFLEAYKEIIRIYYGDVPETIGDIKKYIKIMKNG